MASRVTGQPQAIQTITLPGDNRSWGSLNRYDLFSRYSIPDTDFDELINWFPLGNSIRQVPGNLTPIAQLISAARPPVWMSAQTLNLGQYLFLLGANGHLYQVSLGGVITDCSGSTVLSAKSDITNWQGTTIIISDVNASKIYSWNGTTFATVFSGQPANVITTFSGRLWMAFNNTVTFTAGGTFNSLGGDSGSFTIVEEDCQPPIIALFPFSGQMYIFGYDWLQALGNVTSTGVPAVVNFQINTIESEIGTNTRWSILGLGSTLYWTNGQGVWSLQGTFPQQISGPITGFWQNVVNASSSYSAAFGYIWDIPCLFWNCMTTDPTTTNQQVFGVTMSGQWFRTILSQEIFICSDTDQTTGMNKMFGTDASGNIFQMYADRNHALNSTIQFKFWSFGGSAPFKRLYKLGTELMMNNPTTITATIMDETGNIIPFQAPSSQSQQNFSSNVIFTDSGGNAITWTASVNVTWTGPANMWEIFEWGLDDIAKRFGLQLLVNGMGTTLETVNMELEIGVPKWGH